MASLTARDQENLAYVQQREAASKPLNQGAKGLQLKTPGHRGRIRDENVAGPAGAGKDVSKTQAGQKLKIVSNVLQVPSATPGPGNRNVLAPKTTNAKAKSADGNLLAQAEAQTKQGLRNRLPSVRKSRPAARPTKLETPLDNDIEQRPSSPEIEYIPPRPVDLPDIDDELPPPDLSGIKGLTQQDIITGIYRDMIHCPDEDGISRLEKKKKHQDETTRIWQLRQEAEQLFNIEAAPLSCMCEPECLDGQCRDWEGQRQEAFEKYQRTISNLPFPQEGMRDRPVDLSQPTKEPETGSKDIPITTFNGRSNVESHRADSTRLMRIDAKPATQTRGRNYPKPWLTGSKIAASGETLDGHASRYATAVLGSNTVIRGRKGQSALADLKKTALNSSGEEIRPRKTESQILREMWQAAERHKALQKLESIADDKEDADMFYEEAAEDFILEFDDFGTNELEDINDTINF